MLSHGYLRECCEITVELIFPMIAYLNRMYGDISLSKDMGIICALETSVSLQRETCYFPPAEHNAAKNLKSNNGLYFSVQGQLSYLKGAFGKFSHWQ